MRTSIQVSMFQTGFPEALAAVLRKKIPENARFAFVASEFELLHEKTDKYFRRFLDMFTACGIEFVESRVVDGRMTPEEAKCTVENADVVWLSGGDTPTEFMYLEKYGLLEALREHDGVFIGMSAGAINMARTAVCTLTCGHEALRVYKALGISPYTVEPHLDAEHISEELLQLSRQHELYGICDEAAIIVDETGTRYIGNVVWISGGKCERLSTQ
ncbi:MAG: Type 1 glutamine amidotransferase-like domain-containing protein [Clostridia bacterium]|nr:Type 1 glutamine amidotransferase-like domain-containing protein [Clostridia bacterium]